MVAPGVEKKSRSEPTWDSFRLPDNEDGPDYCIVSVLTVPQINTFLLRLGIVAVVA